jgi:ion channel-forming bestrophin family protein
MSLWPAQNTSDIVVIGKRLVVLLLAVAAYYVAAGLVIQSFQLQVIHRGSAGSLMNTLILSLLLSFRNQVAYARWWEARGLWGQLTNDSRNLAAKCAAYVPAEVLARSRVAAILMSFPEALIRRLRNEPMRLRDLPGFAHEDADPPHVPLDLAKRLFATLAGWKRNGHVDQAEIWILDEHARGLLDVCGGCEKIRSTPLPPAYRILLRAGLVLNVLAAPWLIVPEDGLWSLPVVLLVCFFLFGVELINSVIEEPFGRDHNDLDLDRYCRTIREGVEAMLPSALNSHVGTNPVGLNA